MQEKPTKQDPLTCTLVPDYRVEILYPPSTAFYTTPPLVHRELEILQSLTIGGILFRVVSFNEVG